MNGSWTGLGVGVSFLLGSVTWSIASDWLTQSTPYRNVEIVSTEIDARTLHLVATFEKVECEIKALRVVGYASSVTGFLDWSDDDGLPEDEDRQEGFQTLRIAIDLGDEILSKIEIRTTHACPSRDADDATYVDRVFATIHNPRLESE